MITQEQVSELRQIYADLSAADYKQVASLTENAAVTHSLKMDVRWQRLGKILEGIRWDDLKIWRHNDW